MAELTPITFNTQEEYEEAFKERIDRERKKFDGFVSPDDLKGIKDGYEKQISDLTKAMEGQNKKYEDFDKQLAERDEKIAKYESDSAKTRIASKYNIPLELASRISGADEKEMEEDAKKLASYFKNTTANRGGQPPYNGGSETDMLRATIRNGLKNY